MSALRVLIAGGGTGGHVIPGLAIARELRDAHGAEVRFVGTARGLETRLVPEAGFTLELVRSGQWKNVSLATRLRTAMDLPLGVVACMRLLREFKPQVVVGVGGYASGPGMLAAVLKRVPTLAYEPNAVPGMTNRRLGRWVSAAAVNFPHVDLPPTAGKHRILNVHKNVPGVLRDINHAVSELGANIAAQVLATDPDIGYLVMDLDQNVSHDVRKAMAALPTSIKTRILY